MDHQINIDLTKTQAVICSSCSNNTFEEAMLLRKVSRFVTGTSQDGLIPVQVVVCKKCGTIVDETYPLQLKRMEEDQKGTSIEVID